MVKDAKTAFLQAKPTTRRQKLACAMPPDECFPGYDPEQLIILETEVYGIVSGPSWWRRSLLDILVKELRYRISAFDKCVLTLDANEEDSDQEKTQGVIVIEVDDILEAGNRRHRENMAKLEARLRFGKVVRLKDRPEGSAYAGRRIMQMKDNTVMYTMADYIANRLKVIKPERKVCKKDAKDVNLNAEEESQLRGAIAAVNWVAREGRPDVAAAASILSGCFPGPTMADIYAVNQVIDHLKARRVVLKLQFHPIPENQVRHLLISDSSFDPTGKHKAQHGWLQAITTPQLNAGQPAPVSLMGWKSRRLRRKAGNTLLHQPVHSVGGHRKTSLDVEQLLLLEVLTTAGAWGRRCGVGTAWNHYGHRQRVNETEEFRDPLTVAVVDAKSLYDAASTEQSQGEDDRSALEVAIIHESLQKVKGRIRWIPHNCNPADSLTKLDGAHMQPMMELLKRNTLRVEEETTVLQRGKQGDQRLKVKA